ncbi:CRISPR-associated protein Cas2 [Pullulanibacillus pueri]|uniref:CRISPR-associated endoribonuclease Cas2 n=1 Tax=Pullulanibacillus pueri TaxID=1437324 RepID=A0A8J3EJG3_9BACL|nr:CRISPR-associated endonuclease Cas2 [Pullulanibacillus pueri]MBM7679886.1 CRISPR-associated protein Cas2 [Pullulanibacillus pueri]GGH73319.1 CRISPR-associated endoribonuclease Cas2 [Pullulanibacillus pueri]
MRQYYLVSYDIADQKRWRKVFKTMKGFGEHVQYSVFICQLSELELAKLKAALNEIVHQNQDQVMFVQFGPVTSNQLQKKISTVGRDYMPMDLEKLIF